MKYIKTFENWFTNIFKSGDNMWQDYNSDVIIPKVSPGYNALIDSAADGNWKRFKNLFSKYSKHINDINTNYDSDNGNDIMTLLMHIVIGRGGLWEKKKMLTMTLSNKDVDIFIENEKGQNFYEMIKNEKLKNWFDITYPDIVEKLKRKKQEQKYNL